MRAIYLVCGLPNAGKTTYSRRFNNVIHGDDLMRLTREERKEIFKATAAECIEGVFNKADLRRDVLDSVRHDRRVCVWIDTPTETCIAREDRGRFYVVEQHAAMFEPPTMDEGWDEIIVIGEKENEWKSENGHER